MQKLIANTWKGYAENRELSYIQYWDVNNSFGWWMALKLPVNNFECIKDISQFNKDFIKRYNEKSEKWYFLKIDVQFNEKLQELHNDLLSLPERMKMGKFEKPVANLHDKKRICDTHKKFLVHIKKIKTGIKSWIRF